MFYKIPSKCSQDTNAMQYFIFYFIRDKMKKNLFPQDLQPQDLGDFPKY